MRKLTVLLVALLLGIAIPAGAVLGAPKQTIKVQASATLAPNTFGSPSFADWKANAIEAVLSGKRTVGTPDTPANFAEISTISPGELIVTDFPSWHGKADPGTVFGPAFANELGTRIAWVTTITDPKKGKVDVADGLTYLLEPNEFRPAGVTGSFTAYSSNLVGVDFGLDGQPGGGDDIHLTSGSGEVDAIVMFLPQLGNEVLDSSGDLTIQQEKLDDEAASLSDLAPEHFKITVTFGGHSGVSNVNLQRK